MPIHWTDLKSEVEVDGLVELSNLHPVLILKHSTRCSISSMVLNRLEREAPAPMDARGYHAFYLDLIQFRSVSNWIAQKFGVEHESPQVIVLDRGKVVYQASHTAIHWDDILESLSLSN